MKVLSFKMCNGLGLVVGRPNDSHVELIVTKELSMEPLDIVTYSVSWLGDNASTLNDANVDYIVNLFLNHAKTYGITERARAAFRVELPLSDEQRAVLDGFSPVVIADLSEVGRTQPYYGKGKVVRSGGRGARFNVVKERVPAPAGINEAAEALFLAGGRPAPIHRQLLAEFGITPERWTIDDCWKVLKRLRKAGKLPKNFEG